MKTMPPLPKKVQRREADVDMKVARRLAKIHPCKNWGIEVKVKGGRVKKHQENALQQVEDGTFLYKPPDMGKRNPFDYVHIGDGDAIVCVVEKNLRDVECTVNRVYTFKMRI